MANIQSFIGNLGQADTLECAKAALDALPQAEAWELIKTWIRENDLADEAGVEFSEREE